MSFEALSSITQAEAQAKADIAGAEARAKQLVADTESAGKLAIDAALKKAEAELAELGLQVNEQAKEQAESLSAELENQKAVLRSRAENRLGQAAALVVERIVNS